jgi:hypothetical protein
MVSLVIKCRENAVPERINRDIGWAEQIQIIKIFQMNKIPS